MTPARIGSAGFSLIELMAAMAIFAIVAVIAQQSMVAAMAQSARLSQHSADIAELELAVSLVTRDLENIAPRPVRIGTDQSEPALILAANGQRLTFTRSGVTDPVGRARGPFLRIAYGQPSGQTDGAARSVWPQLDRTANTAPRQAALWDGIQSTRFRIYADGQWSDSWPRPDSSDPALLPEGIAVTFETAKWGAIERVVALR
ncbi:type II secretion system minor pseudopilin GspJ (plasmid) [Marinovum sp. KMM 9989]